MPNVLVREKKTVFVRVGVVGPPGPQAVQVPVDFVDFVTDAVSAFLAGRLRWNEDDQALEFDNADGSTITVGQEVTIRAVNKTGNLLSDGTPVFIDDAQGQRPTILVAENTSGTATARTIGLVTADIPDNNTGPVTIIGLVRGIDTSALTEGQRVWVGVGGDVTSTEPSFPAHNMRIGYCVFSHATEGKILVSTLRGFHLEHLYEVSFSGLADGDFLQRQANGQWANVKPVAEMLEVTNISPATWKTVQAFIRMQGSSGLLDGGLLTDNGDQTFSVALGSGFIRSADIHTAELFAFDWPASLSRPIVDGEIRYIYVEYNGGVPQVSDSTNRTLIDGHTSFELGTVVREGLVLHVTNNPDRITHGVGHVIERFRHQIGAQRAGGLILGETGARNVTITAGEIYDKLNEFDIAAVDTSGADTFDTYRDSAQIATGISQWPNVQYDTGAALADLSNNRYGVLWFYVEDDEGSLVMLYGTSNAVSVAAAQAEAPPASVPPRLQAGSLLIGRIIFQKSAATTEVIETAFGTTFSSSQAQSHNSLADLTVGDVHTQYAPIHVAAEAPNRPPTREGEKWVDTVAGKVYEGVGTASVDDFHLVNTDNTEKAIKDHGTIGTDLEIDWALGTTHIVELIAVINFTFKNWQALGGTGRDKSGTLILKDAGSFPPNWSTLLQTEGETDFDYTAGKSDILEFYKLIEEDHTPYIGMQSAADIYTSLDSELLDDPSFDTPGDWDTVAAGVSISGGQLLFDTAGAVNATETLPFPVVAGDSYHITVVKASNTNTAIYPSIGGVDGAMLAAGAGTEGMVIVAADTTEFSIEDDTGDGTTAFDEISVKRLT